jgi:hypothetical protein
MSKTKQAAGTLSQFVPRPETGPQKRHMIAIDPDAYNYITGKATELETTRGRIITALIQSHVFSEHLLKEDDE